MLKLEKDVPNNRLAVSCLHAPSDPLVQGLKSSCRVRGKGGEHLLNVDKARCYCEGMRRALIQKQQH